MGSFLESFTMLFTIIKCVLTVFGVFRLTPTLTKKKYWLMPIYSCVLLYTWLAGEFSILVELVVYLLTLALLCDIKLKKRLKIIVIQFLLISFTELLIWLITVGVTPLSLQYLTYERLIYGITNALSVVIWVVVSLYFKKHDIQMGSAIIRMKLYHYFSLLMGIGSMSFLITCIQGVFWKEMTVSIQRSAMVAGIIFTLLVVLFFGCFLKVEEARKSGRN